MSAVSFENGEFSVDAAVIAAGLGLDPATVLTGMRQRKITSLCERGIDEDAGRYRLTFFYAQRRFRLVVDEAGTIIDRLVERRRRSGKNGTGAPGRSFPLSARTPDCACVPFSLKVALILSPQRVKAIRSNESRAKRRNRPSRIFPRIGS